MGKLHHFEDMLKSEFRWPRAGDSPFVPSADTSQNATIETDPQIRLAGMMEGYKLAADIMIDQAAISSYDRDFLVYPIIFNYRHFIELSLKYLLHTYGPTVGVEPNWDTHDVARLWASLLEIIEKFGTTDPDDADGIVSNAVAAFSKIDPQSFSMRYPTDKKGNSIPVSVPELDLANLKDVMKGVANFFKGCDGYFGHLASAAPSK